jgi:hypothetical protein
MVIDLNPIKMSICGRSLCSRSITNGNSAGLDSHLGSLAAVVKQVLESNSTQHILITPTDNKDSC